MILSMSILGFLSAYGSLTNSPTARLIGVQNATPVVRKIVPLYMSEKRMLVMLRVGDSLPLPVVFDTGKYGAIAID